MDIDGGQMDGFIAQAEKAMRHAPATRGDAAAVAPSARPTSWATTTQREIPNYWAYAQNFVLQDHMFEPNASWSLPEHLFMVSEWSAKCSQADNPMSCVNALDKPGRRRTSRHVASIPTTPGPISPTCCTSTT